MRTRITHNGARPVSLSDEEFLRSAMRQFGIHKLMIRMDGSKAVWPDCWVVPDPYPVISVTAEWAKQDKDERRKRLVHELLHVCGISHGAKGIWNYSTKPWKDTYSKEEYRRLNGS